MIDALPLAPAKQLPPLLKAVVLGLAMIAKRIQRERGTSNFGRLGRYILRDPIAGEGGVMARTADYILDREGERAAEVRFTNCLSSEAELALKEILATQALNKRAKGDRTYHLVISFLPGERPPLEALKDIEAVLCERIGLGEHQRLSALHLDTGHLHLHVAINKIHPTSFRCIEPYYDKRRLMEACVELEIKHGLARTAHGIIRENNRKPDADRLALIETLKSVIAPKLLGPGAPKSWAELHELAQEHGAELRLRGAGLVFQSRGRRKRVKASAIDRRLSLNALTKRFGPYELPEHALSVRQDLAGHENGRPQTALYQRYLAGRAAHGQAKVENGAAGAYAAVNASYERQFRAIAEDRSLTNVGRSAAFRAYRQRRQAAFDALRQTVQRTSPASSPFPSWPAYVRTQAARGDEEAIILLERWRQRARRRTIEPGDPPGRGPPTAASNARPQQVSTKPSRFDAAQILRGNAKPVLPRFAQSAMERSTPVSKGRPRGMSRPGIRR